VFQQSAYRTFCCKFNKIIQMTSKVIYNDNLRTTATHLSSGSEIITDAPVDNNGKGEKFSPTDLVATALASCMLTVMGIAAETHGIDMKDTSCEVEKVMASNPRRIAAINIKMTFPENKQYTDKEKKILEHAANTCPVHYSVHPDIKKNIEFIYA
jgi:putative redox protein